VQPASGERALKITQGAIEYDKRYPYTWVETQATTTRAMRKLKRWGGEPADADSDIAPLLECYHYTRDKGNGIPYLLYLGLHDRC
jgi:hypothetical protein